jgi:cytochrome P450
MTLPKLFGPDMLADPYPIYQQLREAEPVVRDESLKAWVATSYDAVAAGLRNPLFSSDRDRMAYDRLGERGLAHLALDHFQSLIHRDPPDHTRLRGLINKAFTPKVVAGLEPRIQGIVDQLLDAAPAGGMDVIHALAYPLPVTVIADLLGLPAADREKFKTWSDDVSAVFAGDIGGLPEEVLRRAKDARDECVEYLESAVAARRAAPRDDLLTALLRAEEGGGHLSEDELYTSVILLLIAGNETTTNLIGNGLNALMRHPGAFARVWADPALIPQAVEEMLRFDSPVQLTTRQAKADLPVGGVMVPAGDWIFLVIGAANRDPAHFPDPDRFDLDRENKRHLSFGVGAHFCVGAPLARLEAQVVLRSLRARYPNIRPNGEPPEYRYNFNLRGLTALPVRF